MQPAIPEWDFQFQALMGTRVAAVAKASFRALNPLPEPGLTEELHGTLTALKREIDLEASRGGSFPRGFLPISWARWREMLGRTSSNTIKTRLARLEVLGLIEILPSERGPSGTSLNCYRLRGVGDGQVRPLVAQSALQAQERAASRKRHAPEGAYGVTDTTLSVGSTVADTPLSARAPVTDAPLSAGARVTDTPLSVGSTVTNTPLSARFTATDSPLSARATVTDTPLLARATMNDTPLSAGFTATDTPPTGVSPSYINIDLSTYVQVKYIKKEKIELNRLIELKREKMKKENNQSINQSFSISTSINMQDKSNEKSIDELTDRTPHLNPGLKAFLRAADPGPWPHLLCQELGKILEPSTVPVIEERSPWSAQGAWAILEAIQMKGRNLGNRAGTLWNALLQLEKGAGWLARSGSCSGQAEWRKASGDGVAAQRWASSCAKGDQVGKEAMAAGNEARAKRPEELSPQVKAQLRVVIEDFRQDLRTSLQVPPAEKKGAIDTFAKTFQQAVEALDPWLPLQVTLLDEYKPTQIRDRHQIKTNVLGAIYRALS